MLPKIGIIAGRGSLPFAIATNYQKHGGLVYIAAIEGEATLELISHFKYKIFKIGMVKAVINFFQECGVQNIIFAGGIKRPNLWSIKVDSGGRALLLNILKQKFLGDDKVLRIIAKFFEDQGFKVVSSNEILKNQDLDTDIIANSLPSDIDRADIALGTKILSHLSEFDIGQSIILEDHYVLGIEAAEGTDHLIERCALLRKKPYGGVLVKLMKHGQDARLDVPTIGPDTIKNLAKYHYNGIAIQKDSVIIVDPKYTIELANKHKIFIIIQDVSSRDHR